MQDLVAEAPVSQQVELCLPATHELQSVAELPCQMNLDKLQLKEAKKRKVKFCLCLQAHTTMSIHQCWPKKGLGNQLGCSSIN